MAATEERSSRGALPDQDLDGVLIERESALNAPGRGGRRAPAGQAAAGRRCWGCRRRRPTRSSRAARSATARRRRRRPINWCRSPSPTGPTWPPSGSGSARRRPTPTLQRRERFPDVFALYTPYQFAANNDERPPAAPPPGGPASSPRCRSPTATRGTSAGPTTTSLQTRMEVAALEQVVAAEVENAALEYGATRRVVERIEATILPGPRHRVADSEQLYDGGRARPGGLPRRPARPTTRSSGSTATPWSATAGRCSRLNTAVGVRLLP